MSVERLYHMSMHLYEYTLIQMYIYIELHMRTYIDMFGFFGFALYAHTHINTHIYVYIYIYISFSLSIYISVSKHIFGFGVILFVYHVDLYILCVMYTCTLYTFICVDKYIQRPMCTCIHTYICIIGFMRCGDVYV